MRLSPESLSDSFVAFGRDYMRGPFQAWRFAHSAFSFCGRRIRCTGGAVQPSSVVWMVCSGVRSRTRNVAESNSMETALSPTSEGPCRFFSSSNRVFSVLRAGSLSRLL